MKISKKNLLGISILTVAVFIVGILAAAMISDIYAEQKAEREARDKMTREYAEMYEKLNTDAETLANDISALNERYTSYLDTFALLGEDYYNLVKRYDSLNAKYSLYSGLSPVKGNGIRIMLDDGASVDGSIEDYMVVHDSTLMNIVSALKASGAQAISVNGERIVFSTNIICAGPSITVNGRKIFAPFDIKAIGPDDTLYNNFIASDAYKKITLSELKYDVSAQNDMLVPGFVGNYERDVDMLVGSR